MKSFEYAAPNSVGDATALLDGVIVEALQDEEQVPS